MTCAFFSSPQPTINQSWARSPLIHPQLETRLLGPSRSVRTCPTTQTRWVSAKIHNHSELRSNIGAHRSCSLQKLPSAQASLHRLAQILHRTLGKTRVATSRRRCIIAIIVEAMLTSRHWNCLCKWAWFPTQTTQTSQREKANIKSTT